MSTDTYRITATDSKGRSVSVTVPNLSSPQSAMLQAKWRFPEKDGWTNHQVDTVKETDYEFD